MKLIKTYISLFVLTCMAMLLQAQENVGYDVSPIPTEPGLKDVILTDIYENGGLFITQKTKDYISNWNLDLGDKNELFRIKSSEIDFSNGQLTPENLHPEDYLNISSACLIEPEQTLIFCSTTSGKSSIYEKNSGEFSKPILVAKGQTQYFHPFISEDGSQIFFSSNFGNEPENFDLFFINRLETGWSEPVRLGSEVNTYENQVFPTWYDDTLFYSSTIDGKLDLFCTAKADQYKTAKKLGGVFNSESDDFLLHKKNSLVYYITSNRKNNKDQPFILKKKMQAVGEKMLVTGYLACSGNRISNIPISLVSILGITIDQDITDSEGNFIFRADKVIKRYKLKLEKNDPQIKDCAVLYLTDKNGNVIQKIVVNDEGEFIFEILDPDDVKGLGLKSVEDESLLQIELNGQIYENTPGDVGKGEPIHILSDEGEVIALAYTSPEGKFKFSDLSPESQYKLQFDEDSKQLKLNIIKNGEVIPVPIKNNKAVYERINEENAIELIDDRGENITVEKDEFFNLQNIFYENNSSQLSEIARFQLDRFAKFILNNEGISIELISHTDSKGESAYNLELSERRSKSALNYLKTKGIKTDRLTAYGMGEKQLLNKCKDGVDCSDSEHAINRRTEIRIIVRN